MHSVGKTLLAFALFHFVFQGQICLLLQVSLDFLLLHSAAASKSLQSCLTLCDPIDGSPPGPAVSRQEHWSGLPFPPPMKVKSEIEVAQSCPTLSDPMDYSLPGSSIHGIFQARVLEWDAIVFSHFCIPVPYNEKDIFFGC